MQFAEEAPSAAPSIIFLPSFRPCCLLQIYLVAGNALPTYTGLAPQCSNFAQAAATAAAAAAGADTEASCPAAPQLACAQAQLRPDTQSLQSGGVQQWLAGLSSSSNASGNGTAASVSLEWQLPAGVSATGRPAKVQLSLEGGAAPAFTMGPAFPVGMRNGSSFGMQFALDKPALLIYAGEVGRHGQRRCERHALVTLLEL